MSDTPNSNVVRPAVFTSLERRTRLLLAGLPLLAVLLSPDGKVKACNFGTLGDSADGDAPSDWIGGRFEDGPWWSYSRGSRLAAKAHLDRAKGGERVSTECLYKRTDDSMGVMSLTLNPLKTRSGAITQILVTALDVTHRTRGERASEILRADMAYRMRNSFSVMDALAARAAPGDAQSLSGRLDCVRQAHRLCARYLFFDVPVEDIVRSALSDPDAVSLELDPVSVPARDVEVLLLALSALAEADRDAMLSVRGVEGDALQVVWHEAEPREADTLPDPLSTAILDDIVTLQTGGTATQKNDADGFVWSLLLPLERSSRAA